MFSFNLFKDLSQGMETGFAEGNKLIKAAPVVFAAVNLINICYSGEQKNLLLSLTVLTSIGFYMLSFAEEPLYLPEDTHPAHPLLAYL